MELFEVKVKEFKRLPKGMNPLQVKYFGKRITVRRIAVCYMYEQIDELAESKMGKWIYRESDLEPIKKRIK